MKPKGHIEIKKAKIGVLLINLGTPEGTTFIPMWKYLREFLSDQRVIELSRFIWLPILYLIILTTRPKKSGKLYKKIWNKNKDESPLKVFSKSICNKIRQKFNNKNVLFSYAMNYGSPAISKEILELFNNGCQRILIFPMYPQYSATTTASVVDKVSSVLKKMRWQPTIRFCPPYYDDKI